MNDVTITLFMMDGNEHKAALNKQPVVGIYSTLKENRRWCQVNNFPNDLPLSDER